MLLMELFSNLVRRMTVVQNLDMCHVVGHLHSCSALSFNDPHPPPEFYKRRNLHFVEVIIAQKMEMQNEKCYSPVSTFCADILGYNPFCPCVTAVVHKRLWPLC